MSKLNKWAVTKVAEMRDEEGQGLAEYGLILALVAIACVVALGALGTALSGTIQSVIGNL